MKNKLESFGFVPNSEVQNSFCAYQGIYQKYLKPKDTIISLVSLKEKESSTYRFFHANPQAGKALDDKFAGFMIIPFFDNTVPLNTWSKRLLGEAYGDHVPEERKLTKEDAKRLYSVIEIELKALNHTLETCVAKTASKHLIYHGDVHSGNVLVTKDLMSVYIIDFNIMTGDVEEQNTGLREMMEDLAVKN